MKCIPAGFGSFTATVSEDVDESVAFRRFVERRPIGDVFHSVFFKDFGGVLAKTAKEVVEFARVGVIDAQFVDGFG